MHAPPLINEKNVESFLPTTQSAHAYPPPPGVCPFKHGTIYADPYPGYVQGKYPQVCKSGCQPTINPFPNETPAQMFKREAKEYQ
eukprot:gene36790-44630_t